MYKCIFLLATIILTGGCYNFHLDYKGQDGLQSCYLLVKEHDVTVINGFKGKNLILLEKCVEDYNDSNSKY